MHTKTKYAAIAFLAVTAVLIFATWKVSNDPLRLAAEAHLSKDEGIANRLGVVAEIQMRKATYVQASIKNDGSETAAYNLYDFWIEGTTASALVRVRITNPESFSGTDESFDISYIN